MKENSKFHAAALIKNSIHRAFDHPLIIIIAEVGKKFFINEQTAKASWYMLLMTKSRLLVQAIIE